MGMFCQNFLNILNQENEKIISNLEFKEKLLKTSEEKLIFHEQLIYILNSNNKPDHLVEYLKIKEREYFVLKNLVINSKDCVQILKKLKELKELEISFVTKRIKI